MELIIYLVLAFSAFAGTVALIIGLVSAPPPILVTILILGLMLTQKSISKFNESKVSLFQDGNKAKIESVELALTNEKTEITKEQIKNLNSRTYRGYSYHKKEQLDQEKSSNHPTKTEIKYRGASFSKLT